MFAFLFWLCVIGVPLLWAATTIDRDADDPVGQLLRSVPKVLTQPHLLPVSLRDSEGARSGAERSPEDVASADGRHEGAPAAAGRVSEPAAGADRQASGGSTGSPADAPAETETEAASSGAEGTDERAGRRRPLFDAPAERDDLKRISGIGPVMERHLNELGVVSFAQLAAFSEEDVARVDAALEDFHGRIVRDNWVGQAREIVAGDDGT